MLLFFRLRSALVMGILRLKRGAVMNETGGIGETAHEAYGFVCMNCGHGWEQTYEIRHHLSRDGQPTVTYYTDGKRVPSPLKHPLCVNCGGNKLRIMQSGRIAALTGTAPRR
jgi:hypothetical protein